jgi:hypothetical protein
VDHTRSTGPKAARATLGRGRRWSDLIKELDADVWPEVEPSFRLRRGAVVFTIGSCFARNIEEHLHNIGCDVPMLRFRLPPSEWHGPPTSALNKYSPPAFRQVLAWTAAIHDRDGEVAWSDCEAGALDCGEAGYFDLELAAQAPVTRARFIERRQQIYDVVSSAFTVDCVMMTPGLVEAWRDEATGLYIQGPTSRYVLGAPERFRSVVVGYPQAVADLLAAIDIIRARNPASKLLVTVSPVPMLASFTGQDVRTANTYSKAVLRAACGALCAERRLVDYFPSFESVTLSAPSRVWDPDRVHVSQAFVGKIANRLLETYFDDLGPAARLQEAAARALAEGDHAIAIEQARAALAEDPDSYRAILVLADALLAAEQAEAAATALAGPLARWPDRSALVIRLAKARIAQGRKNDGLDLAVAAAGMADIELADCVWTARRLRQNRPAESERIARLAMERFPLHAEAYQPLIRILAEEARTDELREALIRATSLVKKRPDNLVALARIRVGEGNLPAAAELARLALARRADDPDAAEILARCGEAAPSQR